MTFEVLLKQIVKEAVTEAISEKIGNLVIQKVEADKVKTVPLNNEPKETVKKETVKKEAEPVEIEEEISEVDLGSMKLKELREYAEELGLNSKGKRAEVEERIQEFLNSEESEEEDLDEESEDDDVEEFEESDESDEDEDSEEEESEEDEKYAQVKEYVENASDEEIKETLKELGLSTKGKREALIEKLYQAVKDGLFEFAEDDEDEDEESEDVEDIEESEEESEELLDDMTSERAKGVEELEEKVYADFESGDLTRKDMTTYLKQVGVAVTKKVDDEDVLEMYINKLALLVDDEGEFHEEGEDPYTVNGVPYCCGAKLEVLEDGGYKCNVCGTEYDDEE